MRQVFRSDLDDALPMLQAARAKAEEIGVKQTICICDDGGHPVLLHRMSNGQFGSVELTMAKAYGAAAFRRSTG